MSLSGSICVICGHFRMVGFLEDIGGSGGAIQSGSTICVYLRDLRFSPRSVVGFVISLCLRAFVFATSVSGSVSSVPLW